MKELDTAIPDKPPPNRTERRGVATLKKRGVLPDDAVYLQDLPDERPIMVTRQELPKLFRGQTAQTWANLAHLKQGPKFYRRGKFAWYVVADVIEHLTQNLTQTSNGEGM